ncbi:MAG: Ig-like domain-containing protein [Gemmatimonadota bacterium]
MFRCLRFLPALALLLAMGCSESTSPQVPTSISLETDYVSIGIGETTTLTAVILDQDDRQITPAPDGYEVTWDTTNPEILTVQDGIVTGVSQGTAQVVVAAGDLPVENVVVEILPHPLSGDLSFEYAGQISGTFSVSAEFRSTQEPDWVVTIFDAEEGPDGVTDVIAQYQREDELFDLAWFWVAGRVVEPGTHPAVYGYILMGINQEGTATEGTFDLTEGDITFTTVTGSRMTGTFEYTLGNDADQVVQVTGGEFDAPFFGGSQVEEASAGIQAPVSMTLREVPSRR